MEYETYENVENELTLEEQIEASVKEGITLGLFKDLDGDPTFLKFQEKVNEIEENAVNEDEAMLASLLFAGGA